MKNEINTVEAEQYMLWWFAKHGHEYDFEQFINPDVVLVRMFRQSEYDLIEFFGVDWVKYDLDHVRSYISGCVKYHVNNTTVDK